MTGPIRNTLGEREYDVFVESPTRSNKTAVEVFVGNAGDISGGGGGALNTTPSVSSLTLTIADTEYSFSLPANCKGFVFKPTTIARIYLAYQAGGPYYYCGLGCGLTDNNKYSSQTIYLKSDLANTEINIITYV